MSYGALDFARAAWSHPLAAGDRLGTLWRIFRWQVQSRLDGRGRTVPWVNDARLYVRRGMTGATGNIYHGLHEFADMGFFAHFLRPGDVFADVGANVGTYTVIGAKVCGAKVHAFEPADETLPFLRRNIEDNGIGDAVTVHEVALGEREGTVHFTVGRDTTNQIAEGGDAGSTRPVPLRRLDDELAGVPLAAMKIDVEGAEEGLIKGASQVLSNPSLRAVQIETITPFVENAFAKAGYARRWYDPFTRTLSASDQGLKPNNTLFVRDEPFVTERLRASRPVRVGKRAI
ncbi:FkbM family methyltransferase [Aurantiacibacter luteus]|uniref:Methyltransferase FkbM domain-containing protein n=1 Tax=Aurantiacibacter luteus TaxID=1581420 RepID=A0A0G9MZC8_9SPHN|nr:FkbM family methyltransferase [Aurantiacibacter luteus]KLE36070.1 hypothetical protein AAW00_03150 [Aurantiacibacter luteus]